MPSETVTEEDSSARIAPTPISAAPWRIKAVTVLPDFRLALTFNDESSGIVDCSSVSSSINPGIYAPLANPDFFSQVRIEFGALTWPNGADLDPAWLHDSIAAHGISWSVHI